MKTGFLPVSVLFPTRPKKGDLFSNSVPIPEIQIQIRENQFLGNYFFVYFRVLVGIFSP